MLIIEPHCEGHHLRYLRWIVVEAVTRGYDVYLATATATLKHPLFVAMQKECGGRVKTVTFPTEDTKPEVSGTIDLTRLEFRYWRMFAECCRRLSEKVRLDYVFLPYLDYCAYATALLGSPFAGSPWGGIVIRPTFHLKPAGVGGSDTRLQRIKKQLFRRLLRDDTLRSLFTFDELLIQYVHQSWPSVSERLHFLPEPAELNGSQSREQARQALGIGLDAKIVLVYGSLDRSKGIDALLAATAEDRFPQEVGLLLAGRQDADVRALLAMPRARELRRAGRLHEVDEFLYGQAEYSVFRAADIAWLGYRDQYTSSGVLLQATMAGLPLVACDEGLICWLTRRHELGLTVPIGDARIVAYAISRLAHERELSAVFEKNGRRFSKSHSVDNFTKVVGDELLLKFPVA